MWMGGGFGCCGLSRSVMVVSRFKALLRSRACGLEWAIGLLCLRTTLLRRENLVDSTRTTLC